MSFIRNSKTAGNEPSSSSSQLFMSVGKIKPKGQSNNDTLFMSSPKHQRNSDRDIKIAGIINLGGDETHNDVDTPLGDGLIPVIRRRR